MERNGLTPLVPHQLAPLTPAPAPVRRVTGEPPPASSPPPVPAPVTLEGPLEAMLQELRRLNRAMEALALDQSILRQFLVGPYDISTFTPSTVGMATPAAIAQGEVLNLVPEQRLPGAVLFTSITLSSREATVIATLDGTVQEFPFTALVMGEFALAHAPGAFMTQADAANGLWTGAFVPGDAFGLSFFRSFRLDVRNESSGSINLLDFFFRAKVFRPLEAFRDVFFGLVR